jgi:hypothetical protein
MRIDDISITRSAFGTAGKFRLSAEVEGMKFDGWFDDFGGFLTAVRDFGTFCALKRGKLTAEQADMLTSRRMTTGTGVIDGSH